jgi:hypothetical protein
MSKANVGQMKEVSNFIEYEEVHLLLTIWSAIRSYCMQAGIAGQSI